MKTIISFLLFLLSVTFCMGSLSGRTIGSFSHESISNAIAGKSDCMIVYPSDAANLTTIAASMSDGDTLLLMPGTYSTAFTITKDIKIRYATDSVSVTGTVTYSGQYGTGFGDGSGTTDANSINIDSVEAYRTLTSTTADWSKYFRVTADLNFNGTEIEPLGTVAAPFSGVFDGQGHAFHNATIKSVGDNNRVGMFRVLNGGTVKNLTVKNFDVTGVSDVPNSTWCGIFVGEIQASSLMTNCHAFDCTARVTATQSSTNAGYVGILAGINGNTVRDCTVTSCQVYGDATDGAGISIGGAFGSCRGYATGSQTGYTYNIHVKDTLVSTLRKECVIEVRIGGISGINTSTTYDYVLHDCSFDGTIFCDVSGLVSAGGIVGRPKGGLTYNCYASGLMDITSTVTTAYYLSTGGCFGDNNSTGSVLRNCGSTCTINTSGAASYQVGGVIGYSYQEISNCWYKGKINTQNSGNLVYVGGIAGIVFTSDSVDGCFADVDLNVGYGNTAYGGGAIGWARPGATITNCYAIGTIYDLNEASTAIVFGTSGFFGGFVGYADGCTITQCYAAMGPWSGVSALKHGFHGYPANTPTFTDCLWDTTVAGFSTDDTNATEATTAELMTNATFDGTAFDFTHPRDWKQIDGFDYPRLDWE